MLAALLLVLMGALGFYIAYWISSTGLAYWRAVAGFAVAFMVSWVGGVGLSALVFAVTGTVNIAAATTSLLGKLFWWALICSGYGVYKGRAKFGPKVQVDSAKLKNDAQPSVLAAAGNDSYADALAEIEEGRLDKGVWARSFADAGGEDAKAKALYIKARAGAAKSSVVWENTQPSVVEERDTSVPTAQTKYGFFRTAGRMYGYLCARHLAPSSWLGVGAVVLASMLAIYAYREYRGLQVVAGPTTASQPMAQVSPDQSDWGKGDQPTQSAPGWGDKDAMATPARPNLVPFNGKLDDAPSTSAQSDNDKAMKEHFRLVYAAHPDIEAVLASAGFRAWLVKYPAYERIVVKGTAPEVIGMLNTYKKQNQLPGAAAQSPNAFYKCTGPSGVVYQATPCGTASN